MATSVVAEKIDKKSIKKLDNDGNAINGPYCYEHKMTGHHISTCKRFAARAHAEKQALIKEHNLCFSCLKRGHRSSDCKIKLSCDKCDKSHPSVLHKDVPFKKNDDKITTSEASKLEQPRSVTANVPVSTMCTLVCGDKNNSKTCAKTILADAYHCSNPSVSLRVYVIIDEQSNASFVDVKLVKFLNVSFPTETYKMSTAQSSCSIRTEGYQVTGLKLRGVINNRVINVPFALSCAGLLDTRRDAATPDTLRAHASLAKYAARFPYFDPSAHTMVLLGRNCGVVMGTKLLNDSEPYLYETPLGLSLVGSVCTPNNNNNNVNSNESKKTRHCNSMCTHVSALNINNDLLNNEHVDQTFPCGNIPKHFNDDTLIHNECESPVDETIDVIGQDVPCFHTLCSSMSSNLTSPVHVQYEFANNKVASDDVFITLPDDETPGRSQSDQAFLNLMEAGVCVAADGYVQLPLPFRDEVLALPDNSAEVFCRTRSTLSQLCKHEWKMTQCVESMKRNLEQGYVEQVTKEHCPSTPGALWYIPIFSVTRAKKAKIRLVFDASAQYSGVSINDKLLQGPDLTNILRGVLLRFREKPIALQADIEEMFLNFKVPESQRNYLRFYWFMDNDVNKPLVPYRATTHIFGLTSSPSVANYGLRYCALQASTPEFEAAKQYIMGSFYMDDGLYSTRTHEEAVEVLSKAKELLARFNIRLHKFMSNSPSVLTRFSASEVSASAEAADSGPRSVQRALGVIWDPISDQFSLKIQLHDRPFTKRGVLATVNALGYDPAGLISPVTLVGKVFQRKIIPQKKTDSDLVNYDWDKPLPE